jgi:hypothetical protein
MTFAYTLTVIDDNGEPIVEYNLTADEAMAIFAKPLKAIQSIEQSGVVEPSKPKLGRPKKIVDDPRRSWTTKPCCGSKGARHLKTCTGDLDDKPKKPVTKLTEDQFDNMKTRKEQGTLSTKIFASEYKLSLFEVNKAIHFARYEDYVKA